MEGAYPLTTLELCQSVPCSSEHDSVIRPCLALHGLVLVSAFSFITEIGCDILGYLLGTIRDVHTITMSTTTFSSLVSTRTYICAGVLFWALACNGETADNAAGAAGASASGGSSGNGGSAGSGAIGGSGGSSATSGSSGSGGSSGTHQGGSGGIAGTGGSGAVGGGGTGGSGPSCEGTCRSNLDCQPYQYCVTNELVTEPAECAGLGVCQGAGGDAGCVPDVPCNEGDACGVFGTSDTCDCADDGYMHCTSSHGESIACPALHPTDGDPCIHPGLSCYYPMCGGDALEQVNCENNQWQGTLQICPDQFQTVCPDPMPEAGDACSEEGRECYYGYGGPANYDFGNWHALCSQGEWVFNYDVTANPPSNSLSCNPAGHWSLSYAPAMADPWCMLADSREIDISVVSSGPYWHVETDHPHVLLGSISPTGCQIYVELNQNTNNPSESYYQEERITIDLSGNAPTANLQYVLTGGSNCTISSDVTVSLTP